MESRVDENGAAFAGSQLQIQLAVNQRTRLLDSSIESELPELAAGVIEWRSPLASSSYAEYWDSAFLKELDLTGRLEDLKRFWPTGGPHWDALATTSRSNSDSPVVILVEAKSYPAEFRSNGCGATPESRELIAASLAKTRQAIGVDESFRDAWTGPLYQQANRLAHKYWLDSLGVQAFLVYVLFLDDPRSPCSREEWDEAIKQADRELGLPEIGPAQGIGHVFMKSGARGDLVGTQDG